MGMSSPLPASATLPLQAARRARILVVDGSPSTREHLTRLLGHAGYAVLLAPDGREALKALLTGEHIDAILLSLGLSWTDGWGFREMQLREPRFAAIPTVVMSARTLAAYERNSLRIGSATCVQQPCEDAAVLERLTRMLDVPQPPIVDRSRWTTRDGVPLLWSRRGSVACAQHAPGAGSEQWEAEGWEWIPAFAGKNKIEYACERCDGGPIRRHRRGSSPIVDRRDPLAE